MKLTIQKILLSMHRITTRLNSLITLSLFDEHCHTSYTNALYSFFRHSPKLSHIFNICYIILVLLLLM